MLEFIWYCEDCGRAVISPEDHFLTHPGHSFTERMVWEGEVVDPIPDVLEDYIEDEIIIVSGTLSDHDSLNNLDYALSGHTGFSDTAHLHDDRYYTESEVDFSLAGKSDTSHLHDDRYYTEAEVDTRLDHNTIANTHNLTTDIDHDQLTNFTAIEHFTEASIDHTNIQNIGTNTHVQLDSHVADASVHFDKFTELVDTPSSYDTGKYLISTVAGVEWTSLSSSSLIVVGGDVTFVDTTRSNKQLAVAIFDIGCGRNSSNTTDQYLRTYNGTPMNQTGIPLLFNATLIGISLAERLNNQSWYARVRRNGSTTNIYSHQLVNAYEVHSFTVDVDFSEGDRIQIYLEGSSIDYPQVRTYWRRRF